MPEIESSPPGYARAMALISCVLGILSLLFLVVTGLPALFLGLRSLRAINAGSGPPRGRRLAIAGMVLGAFTTLLTVLGVIAAAILQVQSRAQAATCQNNLRQIGMATAVYHQNYGNFPPGTLSDSGVPADPTERFSWLAAVLPAANVEGSGSSNLQIDIKRGWEDARNRRAVNAVIKRFMCPADPDYWKKHEPAWTTYVGLGGLGINSPTLLRNPDRSLPVGAGFFGYERTITEDDITAGISYTIMVSETTLNTGAWAAGGSIWTVRGLDTTKQPYLGSGRQFGGLHHGGAYMLFVDGSARLISDNIEAEDFERLISLVREKNK